MVEINCWVKERKCDFILLFKSFGEAQLNIPKGVIAHKPSGMKETPSICTSKRAVIIVFFWQSKHILLVALSKSYR